MDGPPTEVEEVLTEVEGPTGFLSATPTAAAATGVFAGVMVAVDDKSLPGSGKFCSRRFVSLRYLKDRTPCIMGRPAGKKSYISSFGLEISG